MTNSKPVRKLTSISVTLGVATGILLWLGGRASAPRDTPLSPSMTLASATGKRRVSYEKFDRITRAPPVAVERVRAPEPRTEPQAPRLLTGTYFRVSDTDAGPELPLPFRLHIPEAFTPSGFEEVAQRAARECGMGLEVVAVDCSEFPCLVWTIAQNDNVGRFSMDGCRPWEDAFNNGTVVDVSLWNSDGGEGARYLSWMPLPPDAEDKRIALKRAGERIEGMKEALGIR